MAIDLSGADLVEGVPPWRVVGIGVELHGEGLDAVLLGVLPVAVQASAIVGYPLLPRLLRVLPQGDRLLVGPDVPEAGNMVVYDHTLRMAACTFRRQWLHQAKGHSQHTRDANGYLTQAHVHESVWSPQADAKPPHGACTDES